MTSALIVLVLLVIAGGVIFLAVRRKPSDARPASPEADTAWNDPVTPGEPARPQPPRTDAAPPTQDPRP